MLLYMCHTLVHMVPIDRPDATPISIDHFWYCYIPWGFTSRRQLEWFEDISFYLGMEVSHNAQEFIVTLVRFDARGNVLSYRFELVNLMQVTEDWGDHTDKTLEEEEEYREFLQDLESSYEEDY